MSSIPSGQSDTQNSSTAFLPLDVIHEVIDQLAAGPSPLAFTYEPGVVQTLCSLCLVNSEVGHRATYHLYARVRICSLNQMELRASNHELHRKIRSLSFRPGRSGGMRTVNNYTRDLIRCLQMCKDRLMIEEDLDKPGLSSLLAASSFASFSESVREVAITLGDSELMTHALSAKREGVRRITLHISALKRPYESIIHRFPQLEHVAVVVSGAPLPDYFEASEELVIHEVVQGLPALAQFILIRPAEPGPAFAVYTRLLRRREVADHYFPRIRFTEIVAPCTDVELTTWVSERVLQGTMSELPGTDWRSFED